MLDAKLLKPWSLMQTETAYRARQLSGLSRNGPQETKEIDKINLG